MWIVSYRYNGKVYTMSFSLLENAERYRIELEDKGYLATIHCKV